MIQERDIREHLAAVIRREVSLAVFERWLASESWNMFNDSSHEAIELVASIHAVLSQRDDDVYSASELRLQLSALLNNITVSVRIDADAVVAPLIRSQFSATNTLRTIGGRAIRDVARTIPLTVHAASMTAAQVSRPELV